MTREEAIKYAEEKFAKGLYRLDLGYLNRGLYQIVAREVDFMRLAIAALREQEEKESCEWCFHFANDRQYLVSQGNGMYKEAMFEFCPHVRTEIGGSMTLEKAIRLARKWAAGHVCTLKEGEAQEYHQMCAEALEKSRWISVEEALPDDSFLEKEIIICVLNRFGERNVYTKKFWGVNRALWSNDITHWMPLPEPPEVEV